MFRSKVKKIFNVAFPIFENIRRINEDGSTVLVRENTARILPSPENFDLKTMLKAGVKLEQVNTKIIAQNDFSVEFPDDSSESEIGQENIEEKE